MQIIPEDIKRSSVLTHKGLVWTFVCAGILIPPFIRGGTARLPTLFVQLSSFALICIGISYGLKRGCWEFEWTKMDLLICGFLLFTALSSFLGPYRHNSQRCLLICLSYAIFYYFIKGFFRKRDIASLFWMLVGLGMIESVVGFYQALFHGETRITGTFYNPNHLAGFLACIFMCLIAGVIFKRTSGKTLIIKLIFILCLGIAIFMTRSRGGVFAILGGLFALLFMIKAKKRAFLILLVLVVLFVIIPNPLKSRIVSVRMKDVYAYSRLSMWKGAIKMFSDHPMLGVGIGNFGYFSHRYAFPVEGAWARYARVANYAHNEFLHISAEMGIPGIIIFVLAFFFVFQLGFKDIADHESDDIADQKAILVGIVALFFHSMVDFVFHIPPITCLLILLYIWMYKTVSADTGQHEHAIDLSKKGIKIPMFFFLIIPVLTGLFLIRQYAGFLIFRKADGQNIRRDIALIEMAVKRDFGCAPYHNSLGGAYFRLYGMTGDNSYLHRGIQEAGLAQMLNPEDYRFPISLGKGFLHLYEALPDKRVDLLERAEEQFMKGLRLAPYLYEGFLGQGISFLFQERLDKALNAFREVVRLEPLSIAGHYWLGVVYEGIGDHEAAYTAYSRCKEIHDMGLEDRALNSYERDLIDFDMGKVYSKLRG